MSEPAAFYEEILYPLQTGVLSALARSRTCFYLTGGTALHRHYFADRYSDDLNLFAERDPRFGAQVQLALAAIREAGYALAPEASPRSAHFARAVVQTPEAALQLDFVNDTAPRFGALSDGALFSRIDALQNILSNKLTALFRLEAKDFADLWTIASAVRFHWKDAVAEAGQKLLGSSSVALAELIRSFPPDRFDSIRWRRRPDPDRFLADLQRMARDLLEVGPNSLAPPDAETLVG